MPEKTANTKKMVNKRGATKGSLRSPQGRREASRRSATGKLEAVQGVYASRTEAEDALKDLYRAGFRKADISVRSGGTGKNRHDVFRTAARLTGGALALSSLAVAAPVVFVMEALGFKRSVPTVKSPVLVKVSVSDANHAAERAGDVLRSSGGQRVSASPQRGSDLKKREYRDETGQIHHHTNTYMRDHAVGLSPSAA